LCEESSLGQYRPEAWNSSLGTVPPLVAYNIANQPLLGAAAGNQSSPAERVRPEEIRAALSGGGLVIGDLMKIFKPRLGDKPGQTTGKEFIQLVKEHAKYDSDKKLRPK
jgi:hypothetical protein